MPRSSPLPPFKWHGDRCGLGQGGQGDGADGGGGQEKTHGKGCSERGLTGGAGGAAYGAMLTIALTFPHDSYGIVSPPVTDENNTPPDDSRRGAVSPIAIEDELRKSYLDYAMSVIVSRALPDARDGLKPVHRRVLFSMNEQGYTLRQVRT